MVSRQPHLSGCSAPARQAGHSHVQACVSGKVWETEGSSPREAMATIQQLAVVVSGSHQLLLVSVVGEGNSRWFRQEPGRSGGTLSSGKEGPHSCVPRAAQTQLCRGPFPGNPWEGLSSLAGLDSPRGQGFSGPELTARW